VPLNPATSELSPAPTTQHSTESHSLVNEYLQGSPKEASLTRLTKNAAVSHQDQSQVKAQQPHTYVELGVDKVASIFVADKDKRASIDHYASQFLTSAALFSQGKVGIAGTLVLYGLATASPENSLTQQATDFALGAVKGLGTRAIFSGANHLPTAPLKGVVTGIGARTLDAVVSRDTFTDPSKTLARLQNETFNRQAMLTDAVTWSLGEGLFHGANRLSGNNLSKSALAHSMTMGASFGAVNGTSNEIAREQAAAEDFNLGKVIKSGLIEATISGAAAAAGSRIGARDAAALDNKPGSGPESQPESKPRSRPENNPTGASDYVNKQGGEPTVAAYTNKGHQGPQIGIADLGSSEKPVTVSVADKGEPSKLAAIIDVASLRQTTINQIPTDLFEGKPIDHTSEQSPAGQSSGRLGAKVLDLSTAKLEPPTDDRLTLPAKLGLAPEQNPQTREFVISSGKDLLLNFRERRSSEALVQVREVITGLNGKKELGPQQNLFVQHFEKGESNLRAAAKSADIVVTSHPELLSEADRQKHAFPDGEGKVWLAMSGRGANLKLVAGDVQVSEWKKQGFTEPLRLDNGNVTLSVMAPLMIGEVINPGSESNKAAWTEFDRQLAEAKKLGIDAVSTDVWWGLIEPKKGEFDWSYYEKLSDHITRAGLKWVPILSFHRCGGNVGDDVSVPLPSWVWADVASRASGGDAEAIKYKSEQGHTSTEYLSLWADNAAMERYVSVMTEFQNHFAAKAKDIGEVNVSLGPAGEMRYPSYNSHDNNTGYPTRGALQAYSPLAIDSFRQFVTKKYGNFDGIGKAWGIKDLDQNHVLPPSDPQGFFDRGDHFNMQYGRDFFDWYNQSLVDHGRRMMTAATSIFGQKESPFYGIDLGAKVPGVHWRVGEQQGNNVVLSDRQAELSAGLIATSRGDWDSDAAGRGYRPIFSMFKDVQPANGQGNRIVPVFTCLEMPDGDGGPAIKAMPHSLASWAGQEAERQGLWLKGENALNGNLYNDNSWTLMRSFLNFPGQHGYYHGLTFLRMGDVVNNNVARNRITEFNTARWRTTGNAIVDNITRSVANIRNMIRSAVRPAAKDNAA
jgi:beta-amylase